MSYHTIAMHNTTYSGRSTDLNEEQAWVLAAQQDTRQFEPLYNRYYEAIFRFIYQRINDKHLSGDLTSEVFMKALSSIKSFSSQGIPFSSWLFRIARNILIDRFRRGKNQRVVNVETSALAGMAEEAEVSDVDDVKMNRMLQCLEHLADDDMQMIEMRYFEKRSFKEIGEILCIRENNAKVKTYRILDKMKNLMTSVK
ncbi:sigma-70 family RNA polymerase sigma factor [soil metagenome]